MQKRKHHSGLAFEGTPLMGGGFVCDLVGTDKPGAKWAEAAALAVARGSIGDEVTYTMEAVKEDARANGFDETEAITPALWAGIELMLNNPVLPMDDLYRRVD